MTLASLREHVRASPERGDATPSALPLYGVAKQRKFRGTPPPLTETRPVESHRETFRDCQWRRSIEGNIETSTGLQKKGTEFFMT